MQTLQQQMAVRAYENISVVKNGDAKDKQKYGTMAHKLPMLIRNAGLAQALAFVEARGDMAHKLLLTHVAETVYLGDITDRDALLSRSREADLATYMLLTRRVLAALAWYKRFTESILKISNTADADSPPDAPAPTE